MNTNKNNNHNNRYTNSRYVQNNSVSNTNTQWLAIALCNARSLRKNVDYITQYIIEHDIDLLTITETRLTDTDQDIINGITFNSAIYTCYRCDRITSTFGGGVAIFLKNNMTRFK